MKTQKGASTSFNLTRLKEDVGLLRGINSFNFARLKGFVGLLRDTILKKSFLIKKEKNVEQSLKSKKYPLGAIIKKSMTLFFVQYNDTKLLDTLRSRSDGYRELF